MPVSVIDSVGATSPGVPAGTVTPMPASTWPRGPRGSRPPNMYSARRAMAGPATTFSRMAASRKPSGAMIRRPFARSSADTIPRRPPKWSMWLCV